MLLIWMNEKGFQLYWQQGKEVSFVEKEYFSVSIMHGQFKKSLRFFEKENASQTWQPQELEIFVQECFVKFKNCGKYITQKGNIQIYLHSFFQEVEVVQLLTMPDSDLREFAKFLLTKIN